MPLALSRRTSKITRLSPLPPIQETDLDRILKLIPTELLAFYTAAVPVTAAVSWRYFPFVLFLVGAALVPLILYLDGRSTHQAARWPQYVVRTLAFVAWANAISWPFAPWASEHDVSWVRSLAILLVPLVGALVLRDRSPAAPPV
jgi:hypothetical protein